MKKLCNARGQAIVEFALILPVLILVLLGILQFGMVMHTYVVINEAAREGVRVAAVGGSDGDVEAKVKSAAASLESTTLKVEPSPAQGARTLGDSVQVAVTFTAPEGWILPLFVGIIPATLHAQANMRVENLPK